MSCLYMMATEIADLRIGAEKDSNLRSILAMTRLSADRSRPARAASGGKSGRSADALGHSQEVPEEDGGATAPPCQAHRLDTAQLDELFGAD